MRMQVAVILMCAVMGTVEVASAAEPIRLSDIMKAAGLEITVPPEWDGIWSYTDSTYTCAGQLQGVSTGLDTLCAGQVLDTESEGGPENLDCTGSATATTLEYTCTGSEEIFEDCTATFTVTADGTRTGDSYVSEVIVDITYAGTGFGCDLVPGTCLRTVTHATRLGPAPPSYCVTPTEKSTFGRVKVMYR